MLTRTSLAWWEDVLSNPTLLISWLQKQYHGEVTAADRIRTFADSYCTDPLQQKTLALIASQEELHASWVATLLLLRAVKPTVLKKDERYWDKTLPGIEDFISGAAVASHAERMRLNRIQVICDHPATPEDIRTVFLKILPQEKFHERAFAQMAGSEALEATRGNHEQGLEALGLTI